MSETSRPSEGLTNPPTEATTEAASATVAQRAGEIGEALGLRGFVQGKRFASMLWERSEPNRCMVVLSRQSRTQYAGEVRYRKHLGFRVRIDLDCEAYTSVYFVKSSLAKSSILRRIWRWRRLRLIEEVPAALGGHFVLAREADWAGALLGNGEAMQAVGDLLARHAGSLQGSVYLEPGVLAYASPILSGAQLEATFVEDMLGGLETIGAAVELLPQPSHPLKPSKLRALTREQPLAAAFAILGAMLGCLLLLGLFGFGLLIGIGALLR